ncbi:hypothetical protein ABIB50_001210 [Mucilaginibacter sp. UYCu711]
MDRINLKCLIAGREAGLQLDKKAMPGETGPCFMITEGGCFKGYISCQKNSTCKHLGTSYYTELDLNTINAELKTHGHI